MSRGDDPDEISTSNFSSNDLSLPLAKMMNSKNIGITTAGLGALVTFGIMLSTTSSMDSLSDLLISLGFYVWVMLPFAVLIALTLYIHRRNPSPASRVAILLTSVIVVLLSVLIYWGSIFNSQSSTSALVFIFIPLYALVATALIYWPVRLIVGLFVSRLQG